MSERRVSKAWGNDSVRLALEWDEESCVTMASLTMNGVTVAFPHRVPMVEITAVGYGHTLAGDRLSHTVVGRDLRYEAHREERDGDRRRLVVAQVGPDGIGVRTVFELIGDAPMIRVGVEVTNGAQSPLILQSVTSWSCAFGAPEGRSAGMEGWNLLSADNDWLAEGRWRRSRVRDLCPRLADCGAVRGEHKVASSGSFPTAAHAPLALLDNRDLGLTWVFQVEHNGAWRWEIADEVDDGLYSLSGPTDIDHSWTHALAPGESFSTVPASFTVAADQDTAVEALTAYRRAIRVPHPDNETVHIVFNDYMNTLCGDPSTERLLPLVGAAAKAGGGDILHRCRLV